MKNMTEFGLFVGLDGDVDGMVHLSDLDWKRPAKKPSRTTRRATWSRPSFSMWTRKRNASRWASSSSAGDPIKRPAPLKKGEEVTCEVLKVEDGGLEV